MLALVGSEIRVGQQFLRSHRDEKLARPLMMAFSSWASVETPLKRARDELPFVFVSPIQWDAAHGVTANAIHELHDVAIMQPLTLTNLPACRPQMPKVAQQQSQRKPRPGHYGDLFRHDHGKGYVFTAAKHGGWVRHRLKQLGMHKEKKNGKWTVMPDQFEHEIELWIKTVREDLLRAAQMTKRGQAQFFKPIAQAWIIPADAFAPWAGPSTLPPPPPLQLL